MLPQQVLGAVLWSPFTYQLFKNVFYQISIFSYIFGPQSWFLKNSVPQHFHNNLSIFPRDRCSTKQLWTTACKGFFNNLNNHFFRMGAHRKLINWCQINILNANALRVLVKSWKGPKKAVAFILQRYSYEQLF